VAMECSWNDGSRTQYYIVILDQLQGRSGGLEWAPESWIRGPLTYTLFEQPSPGLTAEEGLTFNVVGKKCVELQTNINGQRRTITFDNVLYTPGFRSNLISVARLSTKGVKTLNLTVEYTFNLKLISNT